MRPKTSFTHRAPTPADDPLGRAVSAPAGVARVQSAGSHLQPHVSDRTSFKSSKVSLDSVPKTPNKKEIGFLKTQLSAWEKK